LSSLCQQKSKGVPFAENLHEKICGRISHVKMAGGDVGDLLGGGQVY